MLVRHEYSWCICVQVDMSKYSRYHGGTSKYYSRLCEFANNLALHNANGHTTQHTRSKSLFTSEYCLSKQPCSRGIAIVETVACWWEPPVWQQQLISQHKRALCLLWVFVVFMDCQLEAGTDANPTVRACGYSTRTGSGRVFLENLSYGCWMSGFSEFQNFRNYPQIMKYTWIL